MSDPTGVYRSSLALLTDLYQVTMAYGYWKLGSAEREAVFQLSFRESPFQGGFGLACGLAHVVSFLDRFRFDEADLDYLGGLRGSDGRPLFEPAFLGYLAGLSLRCSVDAVPEGTPVFPHEPLVRVRGPLLQCQLLETPLLTLVNFQTLIATKAARVCLAAGDAPVLEFGLRRAQGIDGGLSASRAAYIGGCAATSNVLAGKLYGIPVRGTHAHSWVMAFGDEEEALRAYAHALPGNCIFLVDTYDTRTGLRRALRVAESLRADGHRLVGVRLDSGDLAGLSREARHLLDSAGFTEAQVVASGDLDEAAIVRLKKEGARIDVWGVGTRLATAYDQPALGGVYKLAALRDARGDWQHRVKRSDTPEKSSLPGVLEVRRYAHEGRLVGDVIYNPSLGLEEGAPMQDPGDAARVWTVPREASSEELLVSVYREGQRALELPALEEIRTRAAQQLARLPESIRRLSRPGRYPVGLDARLARLRDEMLASAERDAAGEPR